MTTPAPPAWQGPASDDEKIAEFRALQASGGVDRAEGWQTEWETRAKALEAIAERLCPTGEQPPFTDHWTGPAAARAVTSFTGLAADIRTYAAKIRDVGRHIGTGVGALRRAQTASERMDGGGIFKSDVDDDKVAREAYTQLENDLEPWALQLSEKCQAPEGMTAERQNAQGFPDDLPKVRPTGAAEGPSPSLAQGASAVPDRGAGAGRVDYPSGSGGDNPRGTYTFPDHSTSSSPAASLSDTFRNTGVTADGAMSGYVPPSTFGDSSAPGAGGTYGGGGSGAGSSPSSLLSGSAAAGGGVAAAAGGALAAARLAGAGGGGAWGGGSGGSGAGGAGGSGTSATIGGTTAAGNRSVTAAGVPGGASGTGAAGGSGGRSSMGMMGGGMGGGGGAGGPNAAGGGARYGSGPTLGPDDRRRRRGGRALTGALGAGSRKRRDENEDDRQRRENRPPADEDDPFYDEP